MTDHITTIISALKTQLEAIKEPGYRTDVGDVYDDVVAADGTKKPLLFISTPKTDFTDLAGRYTGVDEVLSIYAVVHSKTAPQAALRSIRADIIQAIEADPTLGASCQGVRILSSENARDVFPGGEGSPPGFDLAKGLGALRVDCAVQYQAYKPNGI